MPEGRWLEVTTIESGFRDIEMDADDEQTAIDKAAEGLLPGEHIGNAAVLDG